MGTDDTAELTDGNLLLMIAENVLAVAEIILNGTVVEVPRIRDDHGLGKINTAAGTDAVVHHFVAHFNAACLADQLELDLE